MRITRDDDFSLTTEGPCDSCGALPDTGHTTRCFYKWVQPETDQAEDFLKLTRDSHLHFVQSGPGGTWKVYRAGNGAGDFGPLVARAETLPEALHHLAVLRSDGAA